MYVCMYIYIYIYIYMYVCMYVHMHTLEHKQMFYIKRTFECCNIQMLNVTLECLHFATNRCILVILWPF